MQRWALSMLASGLLLAAAACADDDADSDATGATETTGATGATGATETTGTTGTTGTTEDVVATTSATETSAPDGDHTTATEVTAPAQGQANPEAAAFCAAELTAEAAATGDPAAAGAAFDALVAAAPEEISAAVTDAVANVESGPGSAEFDLPYAEMIEYMRGNCGFNELTVTAEEYAYRGLPAEVEAGPVIVTLENPGQEFHEILVFQINEGVTETVDELFARPEEEAMTKLTMKGAAFAPNGATSYTTTDLAPGRYVAICFLPTGATPELMSQMTGPESPRPEGAGPPHFTQGMVHEFTVA